MEDELIDRIIGIIQEMISNGEQIPDELASQVAQIIQSRVEELSQIEQAPPSIPPTTQPPSDETQLLWILSGRQPEAFINYLRTYPGAEFQQLLNDPSRLQQVVGQLQQSHPIEAIPQQQQDGIPHSDLQSSNIYGSRYDPKTGRLFVRFQSGSVYKYDGVPPYVFNAFRNGAAEARTNGQNRHGRWWRGKTPSLGAAFWGYIRQAGYPYQRLN